MSCHGSSLSFGTSTEAYLLITQMSHEPIWEQFNTGQPDTGSEVIAQVRGHMQQHF